jgi:chromosome partitioning protein
MSAKQVRVAVMSNAGGTGKTTLATNTAYELAHQGHSVCLFGLDPNASLRMFLGLSQPEDIKTFGSVLVNEEFDGAWPLFNPWPDRGSKIQACLGGKGLGDVIERLSTMDRKTAILQDRLEDYPLPHDFLIFDCPGTVDLLHKVALVASDCVLVPACPDTKGFFATATLLDWYFTQVRRLRLRPAPPILGVVPNRVQNVALHQRVLGGKGDADVPTLPDLLASNDIPLFPAVKEYAEIGNSVEVALPLRAYRPAHPANQRFQEVAASLIKFFEEKPGNA